MARFRGLKAVSFICFTIAAILGYMALRGTYQRPDSIKPSSCRNKAGLAIPETVLLEDFQRPLDLEMTEQLIAFEQTGISQFVDGNILKPYLDDVRTQRLAVEGIELSPNQFPDRPELFRIIEECTRILDIPRPRVFVVNLPGTNAYAGNLADPILMISSSLVRRFDDPVELRFVIGHEMGHIRARHVKWKTILGAIIESARIMGPLPSEAAILPFLPLLKWSREAEMSADNAGLICCQNLRAAEVTLVRLALNIEKGKIGRIDVDEFLRQREAEDLSKFSEMMLLWRQLQREHPFVPDRILQLREYYQSRAYQHIWE